MNQLANPDLIGLEQELKKLPQVECEMSHYFAKGVYARERFAVAGTLIVGKRHREETLSILLSGTLSIYLEGDRVEHKEAPCVWTTPAGAKRMTYSQTDTKLLTVHPTKETDLEKIEEEVIIPEGEYIEQLSAGELQ